MTMDLTRTRARRAVATAVVMGGLLATANLAEAAGSGAVTGIVFRDDNRNGAADAGEAGFASLSVYLFDAQRTRMLAATATDSAGRYSFAGIADGDYLVELASTSWRSLRSSWAPTTTGGSLLPRMTVRASSGGVADLGWRPIARSTSDSAPISEYVGPQGLRVRSYNDVVHARQVYDALAAGTMVGAEGASIVVRLDFGPTSLTSFGALGSPGSYSGYNAVVTESWDSWLDRAQEVLFHEYGHAWAMYYAYLAQQDATLTSYLKARGLDGDSRLDSSHMWDRRELIAEDYRQLFGSADAAAVQQENYEIPVAAAVPGLRDFLSTTFRQASAPQPAPAPSPSPTSSPTPAPSAAPVTVTGVAMNPSPVQSTGTASFTLNVAADVTVQVLDGSGRLVRTLAGGARDAGTSSASWDRTDSRGKRVRSGTYAVLVSATDASGNTSQARTAFTVK